MKTQLTLRPLKYGNNSLRLGLFKADYIKYVQNTKVNNLFIDLGNGYKNVIYKKTYINKGSITNKQLISEWLYQNMFTNSKCHLSFELEITNSDHYYKLIEP